jgi:prevent-host-death family protein
MKTYSSLDLQQRTGEIQRAAAHEPVVITSHGRPRAVLVSVEEFTRLKKSTGEPVPRELAPQRRAAVRRGLPPDPLGYDTQDLGACALAMADAAMSGRNRASIKAEIAAVEKRMTRAR